MRQLALVIAILTLSPLCQAQVVHTLPMTAASGGGPAVFDTVSTASIGANDAGAVSTTIGSSLSKQGLFLLVGLDDTGPYHVQPASVITTNSSGLVPFVWQKVGSYVTGNGNYHGECWMATGASVSGSVTTSFPLTGTTSNPSQILQFSFGGVSQGSVTSAGSGTCVSATSGAQAVTLASTTSIASYGDFDTNDNRTASGCTTTTKISGFTTTGYSAATCVGSTSESLTWSGYGSTSIALAEAVKNDDGTAVPTCAWEGYNPFTGGTAGSNAVSSLSTLNASEHGNNPGSFGGTGTIAWSTTDTGLINNSAELCGDLTTYSSGTTSLGLEETGTGSAVENNVLYGVPAVVLVPTASRSIKICTDASSTQTIDIDLALIQIGTDYVNTSLQCNGTACWFNLETETTGNTFIVDYTTGQGCGAGSAGWVTIAQQITETGGSPKSFVNIYSNTGALLGSASGTATGAWGSSGDTLNFVIGHLGSQSLPSGDHIYFAKEIENYNSTFPPDM